MPRSSGAPRGRGGRAVATVRTFGKIIGSRDPRRLKNLAVFVKGLALGHWAAEHRVDHIHAYWMSTPSTVAMVAASTSRLPWSATAHRWDIYERNAFDVKERSVEYVRAISARGARDLRAAHAAPRRTNRPSTARNPNTRPIAVNRRSQRGELSHRLPGGTRSRQGPRRSPRRPIAVERLRHSRAVRPLRHGAAAGRARERGRFAQTARRGRIRRLHPARPLHDLYRLGPLRRVVLASRDAGEKMMEGVPSALLEAMAFGIPIVATNSGSVAKRSIAVAGSSCSRTTPDALAAALFDVYHKPQAASIARRARLRTRRRTARRPRANA